MCKRVVIQASPATICRRPEGRHYVQSLVPPTSTVLVVPTFGSATRGPVVVRTNTGARGEGQLPLTLGPYPFWMNSPISVGQLVSRTPARGSIRESGLS